MFVCMYVSMYICLVRVQFLVARAAAILTQKYSFFTYLFGGVLASKMCKNATTLSLDYKLHQTMLLIPSMTF